MTFHKYGDILLADEFAATPSEWDFGKATHARIIMPSCADTEYEMQRRGFTFADRTLGVSIAVGRVTADLAMMQRRLPPMETAEHKEDIFRIAWDSFTRDRRFHICPKCDQDVSKLVLREWVDALGPVQVCMFKDRLIGFLALKEGAPDELFVHLASVEEKYRLTGAALSLYARAVEIAQAQGKRKLVGRISSLNTPVMNVYATFGAQFAEPQDIFLKDLRK